MSDGDGMWSLEAQLLASAVDELRVANWQRAARKGVKAPKPIPRPGVKGPDKERIGGARTYTPVELDELLERHYQPN